MNIDLMDIVWIQLCPSVITTDAAVRDASENYGFIVRNTLYCFIVRSVLRYGGKYFIYCMICKFRCWEQFKSILKFFLL